MKLLARQSGATARDPVAAVLPARWSEWRALALMGGLSAILGCVTWLNGILIPFLKLACRLDTFEALLVTFAFYIAYFIMAMPSARVLAVTGYKRGMALGIGVMAVGAVL